MWVGMLGFSKACGVFINASSKLLPSWLKEPRMAFCIDTSNDNLMGRELKNCSNCCELVLAVDGMYTVQINKRSLSDNEKFFFFFLSGYKSCQEVGWYCRRYAIDRRFGLHSKNSECKRTEKSRESENCVDSILHFPAETWCKFNDPHHTHIKDIAKFWSFILHNKTCYYFTSCSNFRN